MNISMWIIADWLKAYDLNVSIKDGSCHLKNIRMLTENSLIKPNRSSLLVCRSEDYFRSTEGGVLCLNGRDYIIVKTEDVDEVYNTVAEAMDFYEETESWMDQVIEQKNNLNVLLDCAGKMFCNPLFVADAGNRTLGSTMPQAEYNALNWLYQDQEDKFFLDFSIQQKINRILQGTERIREPFYKFVESFPYKVLLRNLHRQDAHIGWVMLWEQRQKISKGQEQLLELFAAKVEKWLEHQSAYDILQKTDIFRSLLENRGDKINDSVRLYMNAIGWMDIDRKVLLYMLPSKVPEFHLKYLENMINLHFPLGYAFIYENAIVAVWNLEKSGQTGIWKALKTELEKISLYAGVSGEFFDLTELPRYYLQGKIALKYGIHYAGAVNHINDYMEAYVRETLRSHICVDLYSDKISVLQKYDKKHDTEYVQTLYEYLRHERNQTETAEYLHVHRNTLLKRLARIDELTELNLSDVNVRFQLWVSFMMLNDLD